MRRLGMIVGPARPHLSETLPASSLPPPAGDRELVPPWRTIQQRLLKTVFVA